MEHIRFTKHFKIFINLYHCSNSSLLQKCLITTYFHNDFFCTDHPTIHSISVFFLSLVWMYCAYLETYTVSAAAASFVCSTKEINILLLPLLLYLESAVKWNCKVSGFSWTAWF